MGGFDVLNRGIDVLGELEKLGVPPSWCNSGGRRQFRVMIGHLVAGLIPGRAYVKEIPSAEHKNNRVLWVVELSATSAKTQHTE